MNAKKIHLDIVYINHKNMQYLNSSYCFRIYCNFFYGTHPLLLQTNQSINKNSLTHGRARFSCTIPMNRERWQFFAICLNRSFHRFPSTFDVAKYFHMSENFFFYLHYCLGHHKPCWLLSQCHPHTYIHKELQNPIVEYISSGQLCACAVILQYFLSRLINIDFKILLSSSIVFLGN